jgi:hypothetical protein
MKTIKVRAAKRLLAYASPDAISLIDRVDSVMTHHKIKRQMRPYPNPREYRKQAPDELLTQVQKDLERLGFKFKRLPVHSMDTKAVEAEGSYQSVDYILDLVFRYDQLEVDLYY